MKKAATKKRGVTTERRSKALKGPPGSASLRDFPEVAYAHGWTRNPFAERILKHGMRVTSYPSTASLKEIPEAKGGKSAWQRSPYAARMDGAKELVVRTDQGRELHIPIGKGRRTKERQTGASKTRSVRFSDEVWHELERRATARGLTLHAALREAIATWLGRAA